MHDLFHIISTILKYGIYLDYSYCMDKKLKKIRKSPIKFVPYFKPVIWGGDRICRYKSIAPLNDKIGESWEISAIQGCESRVAEGDYEGMFLSELLDRFGEELLGREIIVRYGGCFPLLVKFIDACDNLSVQVHPNDELARDRHDSLGKTEMWYIIDAEKDARIYAGFNREMTSDEYEKKVKDGKLMDTLANHGSSPGDVFYLPAGRVHAIGAGNLLAEIQESSDITYRIFDYNRIGADGKPRELHTDLAKDAIDFNVYDKYKFASSKSEGLSKLVESEHFSTSKINLKGNIELPNEKSVFSILICIEGSAEVETEEGNCKISKGQTLLIPAVVSSLKLRGISTLLYVTP